MQLVIDMFSHLYINRIRMCEWEYTLFEVVNLEFWDMQIIMLQYFLFLYGEYCLRIFFHVDMIRLLTFMYLKWEPTRKHFISTVCLYSVSLEIVAKILYVIFYTRSGDVWYIPIRQTQQYSDNKQENNIFQPQIIRGNSHLFYE